jgi:hypothetical protein
VNLAHLEHTLPPLALPRARNALPDSVKVRTASERAINVKLGNLRRVSVLFNVQVALRGFIRLH